MSSSEAADHLSELRASSHTAMPLLPISSPLTIQKCAEMELRDTDIFITSYPKSGTTWLQHVVLSLVLASATELGTVAYDHVSDFAPFLEIDPHWMTGDSKELIPSIQARHSSLGRRIFNTHLRCDMLPSSNKLKVTKAKFIYICRSPLDTCVSFFHHLSNQVEGGFDGDFDLFFLEWVQGDIAFGSWADHILSFMRVFAYGNGDSVALNDGRQFLFLTYEEMISDLPKVVQRLVNFLELDVSTVKQETLLPTFSFEDMKANINQFQPKSVTWKNDFVFLRSGESRKWRSTISSSQETSFLESLQKHEFQKVADELSRSNVPCSCKLKSLLLPAR